MCHYSIKASLVKLIFKTNTCSMVLELTYRLIRVALSVSGPEKCTLGDVRTAQKRQ